MTQKHLDRGGGRGGGEKGVLELDSKDMSLYSCCD